MTEKQWHLYILRLENGNLYTGITTDIGRRLDEHRSGKGAKYLRGKGDLDVVFSRTLGSRSAALKAEARVKKMMKTDKEKLVQGTINLPDTA